MGGNRLNFIPSSPPFLFLPHVQQPPFTGLPPPPKPHKKKEFPPADGNWALKQGYCKYFFCVIMRNMISAMALLSYICCLGDNLGAKCLQYTLMHSWRNITCCVISTCGECSEPDEWTTSAGVGVTFHPHGVARIDVVKCHGSFRGWVCLART